jgi:hypothetical protein
MDLPIHKIDQVLQKKTFDRWMADVDAKREGS